MMTEQELMPETRAEKLARRIGCFEAILRFMLIDGRLNEWEKEMIAKEYGMGLYLDDEKNRKLFSNEIQ